jgi:hypothetical protein
VLLPSVTLLDILVVATVHETRKRRNGNRLREIVGATAVILLLSQIMGLLWFGRWFPLPTYAVIPREGGLGMWLAHPHSWFAVHRIAILFLGLPIWVYLGLIAAWDSLWKSAAVPVPSAVVNQTENK